MDSLSIVFCVTLILSVLLSNAEGKKVRPHFLVIVSDDLGYADLGYTGGVMPTPTLDSLAEEGTKLTNFYVHPVCTPTRAALMTGRVAAKTGLTGPLLLASPCALPEKIPTIGEEMQKLGYHTIISGKWHLGHHCKGHTPAARGFDEFYGVLNCCATYMTKIYWHPIYPAYDWREGHKAVVPLPSGHASYEFADYLGKSVERHLAGPHKNKPLLMLLTLTAPHSPLQPTQEHYNKCKHVHTERRRLFCGLVVSVDEAVRHVKSSLEKSGIWDNTIVFHFNDNGGNVWEGGRNYPFRGAKRSSFEGGSRAVAFARIPNQYYGSAQIPRTIDGLMHVSDIMPTILAFAADSPSKAYPKDYWKQGLGYDLKSTLLGLNPSPREDVLMSYDEPTNMTAYRYKNWKLIVGVRGDSKLYPEPKDGDWVGTTLTDYVAEMIMHFQHWANEDASGTLDESVREIAVLTKQIWKELLSGKSDTEPLLFDLKNDPYEDRDIADKYPEVVTEMLTRIAEMKNTGFDEPCNWWVTDTKVEHEKVTYFDPITKSNKTVEFHGPWVDDDDWENYSPDEWNMLPLRMRTAYAIVIGEILITVFIMSRITRSIFL